MSIDVVILGAGLAGMSFAYHYDRSVPVFEKEALPGGLTRTIDVGGCRLDLAPHFLHLRNEAAKRLVFDELGARFARFERRSSIYIHERLVGYPFELHLSSLDEATRKECLAGAREIEKLTGRDIEQLKLGSYRDYALKAFGKGIAEHYLLPYNRKIWDTDPAEMTCEWMERLPTVDKDKIIASSLSGVTEPFGYNANFFYPNRRGMRELADALAAELTNVRYNWTAVSLDLADRKITFKDGETINYSNLVSTIPLNELARLTGDTELIELADHLHWTTVYSINLVVTGSLPDDLHWAYFPDPEFEFFRASFPRSIFPGSSPQGRALIALEIGSRNHGLDIRDLERQTMERIGKISFLRIDKIEAVHSIVIPVAYCIYDRKRTSIVAKMLGRLEEQGVHSIGRYGRWEYSAMEDALLQGRDLAADLRRTS